MTEQRKKDYRTYLTQTLGKTGFADLEIKHLELCDQVLRGQCGADTSVFEAEGGDLKALIDTLRASGEFFDLNRRKNGRPLLALERYGQFMGLGPVPADGDLNGAKAGPAIFQASPDRTPAPASDSLKAEGAGKAEKEDTEEAWNEAPPSFFTEDQGEKRTPQTAEEAPAEKPHLSRTLSELLFDADPGNPGGIPKWSDQEISPVDRARVLRRERERKAREEAEAAAREAAREKAAQEAREEVRRRQEEVSRKAAAAEKTLEEALKDRSADADRKIRDLQAQIDSLRREIGRLQPLEPAAASAEPQETAPGTPEGASQAPPSIVELSKEVSANADHGIADHGIADPGIVDPDPGTGTGSGAAAGGGAAAEAEPHKLSPMDDPDFVPRSMKILLGRTIGTGEPENCCWEPNNTSRVFHMNTGIIGTMGTGKTQFTKSLITQLMRKSADNFDGTLPGLLIFDYKGDYNETKQDFVDAVNARVLKPYRLPFNPFSMAQTSTFHPLLPTHTANAFKDILSRVYHLGPKQQNSLFQCIMAAYESCGIDPRKPETWSKTPPTFATVFAKYEKDDSIPKTDSLAAAMNKLTMFDLFEPDPARTGSLFDLLQGAVVFDLSGYDPDIQSLVAAITLQLFYTQMVASGSSMLKGNLRQLTRLVLVDEADNFMSEDFPSLKKILKEGREFGVGVVLSTQSLKHFQTDDNSYADYIMTWVVHNVADLKDKDIDFVFRVPQKSLRETQLLRQVRELGKFQSLVRIGNEEPVRIRDLAFWELMKYGDGAEEPAPETDAEDVPQPGPEPAPEETPRPGPEPAPENTPPAEPEPGPAEDMPPADPAVKTY